MAIIKTVLKLTVLHDTEVSPPVNQMYLEDLAREIDDGDCIGQLETLSVETLDGDKVVPELLSIGNDGYFFNVLE